MEQVYHQRAHTGLNEQAPIDRWRQDLLHVRPLRASMANRIDDFFYHQFERRVRKDGTVSWNGMRFEVAYHLSGEKVTLIVDPHTQTAIRVESEFGDDLGPATRLDVKRNLHRKRQRPHHAPANPIKQGENAVDLAHRQYQQLCHIPQPSSSEET